MAQIGDTNTHGQSLMGRTTESGNHRFARKWILKCGTCGRSYGANSCDFHIRRCSCQGGKAGLPFEGEANARRSPR